MLRKIINIVYSFIFIFMCVLSVDSFSAQIGNVNNGLAETSDLKPNVKFKGGNDSIFMDIVIGTMNPMSSEYQKLKSCCEQTDGCSWKLLQSADNNRDWFFGVCDCGDEETNPEAKNREEAVLQCFDPETQGHDTDPSLVTT